MELSELSFNLPSEYRNRLDAAWESLDQDVKRWQKIVPIGTTIAHHINEFVNFKNSAYGALVPNYQKQVGAQPAGQTREAQSQVLDVEDFRGTGHRRADRALDLAASSRFSTYWGEPVWRRLAQAG